MNNGAHLDQQPVGHAQIEGEEAPAEGLRSDELVEIELHYVVPIQPLREEKRIHRLHKLESIFEGVDHGLEPEHVS